MRSRATNMLDIQSKRIESLTAKLKEVQRYLSDDQSEDVDQNHEVVEGIEDTLVEDKGKQADYDGL